MFTGIVPSSSSMASCYVTSCLKFFMKRVHVQVNEDLALNFSFSLSLSTLKSPQITAKPYGKPLSLDLIGAK